MFFTRLYQNSSFIQLHVLDTYCNRINHHLLSILLLIQKHFPWQILRLLDRRYIYCVDPIPLDLDLNFMHILEIVHFIPRVSRFPCCK